MDSVLLRAIPFFQKLTDLEVTELAALIEVRDHKRGDRIVEEATVPAGFYIIQHGVVHVRRRANTREMLLTTLGAGAFFGEITLFDPGVATASVYAKSDCRLAFIPYDRFRAYMDQHPHAGYRIASAILTEVAHRLRTTSARLANSIYRQDSPDATAAEGAAKP